MSIENDKKVNDHGEENVHNSEELHTQEVETTGTNVHLGTMSEENAELRDQVFEGEDTGPNKKTRRIVGISLIALAVIIVAVVVYFIVNPDSWRTITGSSQTTEANGEKIDIPEDNSNVLTEEDANFDENKEATEGKTKVEEVTPEKTNEPVTTTTTTTNTTKSEKTEVKTEPAVDKWGLKRPCFVISAGNFSTEDKAKVEKAKLVKNGFKSGYFYIPDYQSDGQPLFKVYVGPFKTRDEADKLKASVKKVQPGAFTSEVK
jgi:cell division protein FtsN